MYLAVNIVGIFIFLAIAFAFSKNRRNIKWRSIILMLVINLVIAWFFTSFSVGTDIVKAAADGFNWLVDVAYEGIAFALASWVNVKQMDFVTSALLPILMIVPLFDILTYIGVLPFIIKWIGRGLAVITGQPKFESFFAVEMMFLGNTEALAVSSLQLKQMKAERDLTLAMMSMSCVTASILGAYTQMMPGQYILTAVPINIINAIIVTNLLNPLTVTPEEDTIARMTGSNSSDASDTDAPAKREPFFSFLGDSILGAGRLILIIAANVIAFVALAALIDKILMLINPWLTLEHILGIIMFPFAWLTGLNVDDAFKFAQFMGTKLVTNEFVVMGKVTGSINNYAPHFKAMLTVFLTSFANFSTVGMIIGAFKGLVDKEKNDLISANVGYLLLSGILVSLLSAGIVGVFVW
ncbi:MAG: NupC/NupG family nucleoside CNT transporter [Loigolactobacillus coryniformis]|jgi:CNT family concentrative nucleoside transporter/purine nucleoside transport protein|uniref:Pyrimidine-specific nucleoside symporter n=3 Tax=Loigolactobacillus coryniformis TaxID=1610 RepID=J3JBE1_9LACO|nr:nucleoside transporter C-terminal domain-containing protein [Loigolactobacillus coryniformis]OEH89948.1 nucleoside permease [Loigolactobacillus coryniformis subsp. coryniformis]RRG05439.1 MAG: NupC/NupG family nucleoside CNT transporter [Lactobacillus sp.]ATO55833.1 nucleoside permease [Loigolactobacillus coryniformis subsp. coryniformis KCTC 3167 = DSM 20001]EJN55644.1 Pyrimidine-specific nucleoside symporter [Loigolactobacillus coryniformis subsp. coryniformis CECT 5711]KRK14860.1 pyrimid